MDRFVMTASNVSISELKSNRKYLSVSMRMFSTRANLNKCAVTEAFIDEIIANKDDYVCMGLFADVPKLKKKDYRGLTHMYDRRTDTFYADQIGSFYDFEKVEDEYGTSLIGYARVAKRSKLVCEAIEELYDNGQLNFSFEISAGAVDVIDGITVVDANEENELTGMAIVSVPAYPESKALGLVAENEDVNRFYASATVQLSEVDFETVQIGFYNVVREMFGEEFMWRSRVLLFCTDCVILYCSDCGETIKVEYLIDDNDCIVIKDMYPVDFVRSGGSEEEMDKETLNTQVEEQVAEEQIAEVVAEEVVSTDETVEVAEQTVEAIAEETEVVETAESTEELSEKEDEAEEEEKPSEKEDEAELAKKRCAELEAQIAELMKDREELEKIKAERANAELAEKKDQLRQYATDEGLDVNETKIAEAIENVDYGMLVAEVIANRANKETVEQKETYAASYDDMPIGGSFDYLLADR